MEKKSINKSCPSKLVYTEVVDQNCLKLSLKYEDTTYGIFCTYAPSLGQNTDFLLNIRRNQLNSTEDHTAIIGDLNCTLDQDLDKYGYTTDHHWGCREIIKECLDSGDLQGAFRHLNPETKSYNWKNYMMGKQQGRIDFMLLSPGLINMVTSCFHKHHPSSLTDHSSVNATFRLERTSEGPGVFRQCTGSRIGVIKC